ncbi:MAG: hypothetical protein ACTSRR_09805 [Candidatus Heimdallarchaeaceae archaeon]
MIVECENHTFLISDYDPALKECYYSMIGYNYKKKLFYHNGTVHKLSDFISYIKKWDPSFLTYLNFDIQPKLDIFLR